MVVLYSIVLAVYLGYTLYHDSPYQYLLVSLNCSLGYLAQRYLYQKDHSIIKVLWGEFPSHILFLVWLYFFKLPYFLHYIPLILSNSGKIYWLLKNKNPQIIPIIQQLILFQSQCEAFICLTLLLSAISLDSTKILQFLSYLLILKIKYRFYVPSHKAYNQIHFFFDRISRYLKFRSFYHFIYQVVSYFSNETYSPTLSWEVLY